MFGFTLPLLLTALYAGRIAAEVPASCQQDRNGFFVTEDTYLNKIVAFQVALCVNPYIFTTNLAMHPCAQLLTFSSSALLSPST